MLTHRQRIKSALEHKEPDRVPIGFESTPEVISSLWGNEGGVILAPSHESLPETPVENIEAIYKVVKELT